jgi:hypothetical protein
MKKKGLCGFLAARPCTAAEAEGAVEGLGPPGAGEEETSLYNSSQPLPFGNALFCLCREKDAREARLSRDDADLNIR